MRKVTVLLLVMAALLAAPVFADETDVAFSGDFTASAATDFSDYGNSIEDEFDLNLTFSCGDYTSFSAGFDGSGFEDGYSLVVDDVVMTQDFTGVFGDGMILKYSLGYQSYEAEDDYWQFTGYDGMADFNETSTAASVVVTFGVEQLYAAAWISDDLATNDEEFAAEVTFAIDAVTGAVNYTNISGDEDGMIGGTVNYAVDTFEAAVVVKDDLDAETVGLGLNVALYMIDKLTPSVAYYCTDSEELAETSFVGASVEYALSDNVVPFAGVNVENFDDAAYGLNAGVELIVDNVTFDFSGNYGANTYNGYDAGLFGDEDFYMSLVVDADF